MELAQALQFNYTSVAQEHVGGLYNVPHGEANAILLPPHHAL